MRAYTYRPWQAFTSSLNNSMPFASAFQLHLIKIKERLINDWGKMRQSIFILHAPHYLSHKPLTPGLFWNNPCLMFTRPSPAVWFTRGPGFAQAGLFSISYEILHILSAVNLPCWKQSSSFKDCTWWIIFIHIKQHRDKTLLYNDYCMYLRKYQVSRRPKGNIGSVFTGMCNFPCLAVWFKSPLRSNFRGSRLLPSLVIKSNSAPDSSLHLDLKKGK